MDFKGLVEFLKQCKLSRQKLPERLEIVDEFPMTPSGKIKKHELRKDVAAKIGLPPRANIEFRSKRRVQVEDGGSWSHVSWD